MVDALTALGLASNVVQLISFTSDIISKSREIYKSHGKLVEHMELQAIASSLRDLSSNVIFPYQQGPILKRDENLWELCSGCSDVSDQLLRAIQNLQIQGENKPWKSFRQALMSIWKEDEIAALTKQLDRYRAQIDTILLVSLTAAMSEQTQRKWLSLEAFETNELISARGLKDIRRWAEDLTEAI